MAGIIGTCHHTQLIFVFLVETGFCHVGQASLELLTSGDPPASASQSAGIIGMSHCAQLDIVFLRLFTFFWGSIIVVLCVCYSVLLELYQCQSYILIFLLVINAAIWEICKNLLKK